MLLLLQRGEWSAAGVAAPVMSLSPILRTRVTDEVSVARQVCGRTVKLWCSSPWTHPMSVHVLLGKLLLTLSRNAGLQPYYEPAELHFGRARGWVLLSVLCETLREEGICS